MLKQDVIIYLHTPITKDDAKSKSRLFVLQIKGKVVQKEQDGVVVQIKQLYDGKDWFSKDLPLSKIFLPTFKIDFMEFL